MASPLPLRPSLLPQCSSCVRRVANLGLERWRPTYQQPARGKKTSSKQPDHITVRLLKDVKSFGRAGTLVPVTAGQMRNKWFPRGIADYVTAPQLKDLRTRNVPVERDFLFGVNLTKKKAAEAAEAAEEEAAEEIRQPKAMEVELLSPDRTFDLLTTLLPPHLEFHRTPITPDAPPPAPAPTPRRSASSAADDLAAASPPPTSTAPQQLTSIYGSVSASDVARAVREILSSDQEGARVVVTDEDVRFVGGEGIVGEGEGEMVVDRVKALGEYEIEIQVRGAPEGVRRRVLVLPNEVGS